MATAYTRTNHLPRTMYMHQFTAYDRTHPIACLRVDPCSSLTDAHVLHAVMARVCHWERPPALDRLSVYHRVTHPKRSKLPVHRQVYTWPTFTRGLPNDLKFDRVAYRSLKGKVAVGIRPNLDPCRYPPVRNNLQHIIDELEREGKPIEHYVIPLNQR